MSATQDIYQVIEQLCRVQERLAIAEPVALQVKRAWRFFPPASLNVALETPAFTNEWTLVREVHGIDFPQDHYTIHSQLLVDDADLDRAARIATAFMPVILQALWQRAEDGSGGVSLGGTVDQLRIRGGNPTLARFDRAEKAYIGLDLYLDVELSAGVALS